MAFGYLAERCYLMICIVKSVFGFNTLTINGGDGDSFIIYHEAFLGVFHKFLRSLCPYCSLGFGQKWPKNSSKVFLKKKSRRLFKFGHSLRKKM